MIELSRLNGKKFVLNCDLIKTIESTPDTLITLLNNDKYMVKEPVEEVIQAAIQFWRRVREPGFHTSGQPPHAERGL